MSLRRDAAALLGHLRAPRPPRSDAAAVIAGIEALDAMSPPAADPVQAAPIFVLGTAWRTGSTLLQRILCTDERVLVWGEPLAALSVVPRLVAIVEAAGRDVGAETWTTVESHRDLATGWVANMFPADLRAGMRALLDRWLAEPAAERGFGRWGFKEVRLGASAACLLRWLYPRASFVVITRDPRDAYRSLSRGGWDKVPVGSPTEFARHWAEIERGWRTAPFTPIRLRYEDVVAGRVDFRALEAELGVRLDERRALGVRVGATDPVGPPLSRAERLVVTRAAGGELALAGYRS